MENDVETMLRTMEQERDRVHSRTQADGRVIYGVLAVAYLLGFGGQFLLLVSGGSFQMMSWIVPAIIGSLCVSAIFWYTHQKYRGIRGLATRVPLLHGLAWILTLGATIAFMLAVSVWSPTANLQNVALVVSCGGAGSIYLALGTFLTHRLEQYLGAWLLATSILVLFLPPNIGVLTVAVLGSLGFIGAWRWTSPPIRGIGRREVLC